jgi:signal transduction histidine kinase
MPDLAHGLAIVQRLVQDLSGCFDAGSIADRVVSALTDELGLHSCSIMLVDSAGERMVNLAGASPTGRSDDQHSFRIGEGVAGQVALHGQAMRVDDTRREARFFKASNTNRSLLCFPLCSGDRVIGVLNLSHPVPGFFSADHEAVFSVLSTMLGHLLTFARLQGELADFNRRLEMKVEEKTKEVEVSQRLLFQQEKLAALGTLVAGVAHELNNKLVPLLAYSHVLAESPRHDDERRLVASMASAAVGAKKVVEGLLRFARQEQPQMAMVNGNDLIEEVTGWLPHRADRRQITVRTALDPLLPPIWADAQQLGQVLINLINNAFDAMGECGELEIRSRGGGTHVELDVIDDGSGIPPEVLSQIFDPFFTTKDVGRGTGLGLSLCYGMIRAHRGEIGVESRPGRTVFTVRLPVSAPSTAHSKEHAGAR